MTDEMDGWFDAGNGLRSPDDLSRHYAAPHEIVARKQIARLDAHCRTLIAASPFVVLATTGACGLDCSPRGGPPGFVAVHDERTLLMPDWPGNNRLDSLRNILQRPAVGLLFLVPGAHDVFRVNGSARLSTHPDLLGRFAEEGGRLPRSVIVIGVEEAYVHCPRALAVADLWNPARHVAPGTLPSLATILEAHVKLSAEAPTPTV